MKGQKNFETYVKVPHGSTLQVTIDDANGVANGDAQLVSSTEVAALIPGPGNAVLQGTSDYFLRVRLAFLAAGTAVVNVEIRKPGGTMHSEACQWQVTGAAGSTTLRGCFIHTV